MPRIFLQEPDRIVVVEDRKFQAARGMLYSALFVLGIAVAACLYGSIA